jgi:hypothetical protein
MSDVETLAERVRTVERAVTEGDHTFPAVDDVAELTERLDALEQRVQELDDRTAELEGATQALRGYVGNVRSVNERVEQRADTALAATERLERRLDEFERPAGPKTDDAGRHRDETKHASDSVETVGRRQPETPEPPDIGTTSTDERDRAVGEPDDSDGAADTGVLERIRSLL